MSIEESAGFVVFRHDDKLGLCFLGLHVWGRYDLPKGHLDIDDFTSDNPYLARAKKELAQEASITIVHDEPSAPLDPLVPAARMVMTDNFTCINKNKQGKVKKHVYLYIAETEFEEPVPGVNEDGIQEHDFARWIPVDELDKVQVVQYLIPGIKWAIAQFKNKS